ncbi:MAG: ATP-binding protein [Candidatus Binatia bacterium]
MTGKISKVLLVEDNPGDALLLREALKDLGGTVPFDLAHVGRLDDALQKVKAETFDAVLLDLSLPDARGVETVARVQEAAPRLPIVVLTGLDDDAAALEAVRAGAQDYLVKGQIDGRLLVRALSYAIERKRTQKEIEQHLRRIIALKDINVALTATLELSAVLKILLEKVGNLMPEFSATVTLWDEERSHLVQVACRNLDEKERAAETVGTTVECHFTEAVFRSKTLLIVNDVQNDTRVLAREFYRRHGFKAYLGIPLSVEDQVLGVLSFYAKKAVEFSGQETEFFSAIASQASVAIRNSQVHGELKRVAGHLERSNRIKEEFLGVISHELRTPLNVVKGYVELLRNGVFGELGLEQHQALEKIAGQTKDQLTMVNSILHAITIESDVTTVHLEKVSMRDFLDEIQSTSFSPPDKQLIFQWGYSPELPVVKTDKTKLRYILQNLINNAVKFTQAGQITVSAAVLDSSTAVPDHQPSVIDTIWLRFDVADTGSGISAEFLPLIFEKFSQVDSSTTRVHGGIGLGLHIVKRCTELLKGTINVESEPGKGSTFCVMIPCEVWGETT